APAALGSDRRAAARTGAPKAGSVAPDAAGHVEIVAEDAGRAAENRAGEDVVVGRVGDEGARGRAGKAALGIVLKAPGQRYDKGGNQKKSKMMHSALPPEGFVMPRLSARARAVSKAK